MKKRRNSSLESSVSKRPRSVERGGTPPSSIALDGVIDKMKNTDPPIRGEMHGVTQHLAKGGRLSPLGGALGDLFGQLMNGGPSITPGKPSELRGVRSRSAEEGGSSSSLSDALESFVGKLKDYGPSIVLGNPNELQGEDILPVFSAIASRRDLVDKEQAEHARSEKSPGEREQAEKYRFENHRKLASMEKVVAGLQTVIAYFEEARLRREQEMTKNERTYRIKERLKAEEANARLFCPLPASELVIRDLSSLARCAIFRAVSKLYERNRRLSSESSYSEAAASNAETTYSVSGFCGRTPELLDLLHDAVLDFEKIDIYLRDEAGYLLENDRIARTYYDFWKSKIIDRTDDREEVAVKTMCQGLAFLVRHLIVSYDGEKIKLRNLLQDVSPELAIDYDLLRQSGVNPRFAESFLKLAPKDHTRLEATDTLDFLELVAPGLFLLLRSDLLQIAAMYPYHHIAPNSSFTHPELMDAEGRECIERILEGEQQAVGGADLQGTRTELFKILSGAGTDGPWGEHSSLGSPGFRQLYAVNLDWYKSKSRLTQWQGIHHKSPWLRGSSDGWSFLHTSLNSLPLASTIPASSLKGAEGVDPSTSSSAFSEIDGSQY